jgi:hypothetical protein
MKRDLNLIRKMVLAIEDNPAGRAPDLKFAEYAPDQIGYHAYLLVDAGLAKGINATVLGSSGPDFAITSLTWAGHEFAEAARDDTRWKSAMGIVTEKGGSVTIEILTQLLIGLMKGAFGLPLGG